MAAVEKRGFFYVLLLIFLTVICFSMLYPFVNLLFISFSAPHEVVASKGLMLYPKGFNIEAYKYLMKYPYLGTSYLNTVIITITGTALAMVVTTMGGYVLSKKDLPGRTVLTTFVVLTMFIGGGLVPTYLNMRNLKLLNSLAVLVLPFAISTWNMLLMRNFVMGIPYELSESARIDGCGETRLLLRIILPLSTPILATLALFYGVGRWSEYSSVIIYNTSPSLQTIQVIIRKMYDMAMSSEVTIMEEQIMPPLEAIRAATVIFTTVPILCVYPFLQKYFAQGLMVGSVKG